MTHATLKERIAAEKTERLARYETFASLTDKAHAVGMLAGNGADPNPIRVVDGWKEYILTDGACGFAWVNVKPGGSSFARWLIANGKARRDGYYGGVTIWVPFFGQSMARKEAYALAYARTLQEAGIDATPNSRLD
jgi:hypothetical protein